MKPRRACPPANGAGSYLLVLWNRRQMALSVGRLGTCVFPSGRYVYCGSARGGLLPRVRRHLQGPRCLHWHIDLLTGNWEREGAWLFPGRNPGECELAAELHHGPGVRPGPRGFGSSDCRCPTHLFRLPRHGDLAELFASTLRQAHWYPAADLIY